MAQYNIKGDIANVTERQLEFINKVILEQNLKVKKTVLEPVGKAGDNFASNVKRINIESENGNMKMILKIAPSVEMMRQMANTAIMFKNEHIMYTKVLPMFASLQKAARVPKEDQLRFAKCYGSLTEQPNEVIILEDLKESGFGMMDKFQSLSNECVRSILKSFAIYHSLSYALYEQDPETFEDIKGKLTNIWTLMHENPDFMMATETWATEMLIFVDDETDKEILKNILSNVIQIRSDIIKNEDNKYSVIQQGDAWTNNMLFKVEGDSVQSVMIDYQASNFGNPVVDLFYIILNCTDHATRSKHYYEWIDYYHSELDKSLSNFGMDVSSIYPRNRLDADLKKYSGVLFSLCVLLCNLLMRDTEEAGELMEAMKTSEFSEMAETMTIQQLQSKTFDRIKTKVTDLVASMKEFNYV
uniref:CHK kinase-like domain-containing protein n=1 Tax=Heliothis virescens TaxID=7102 RepID=A0A2A4JBZ6_HELVI